MDIYLPLLLLLFCAIGISWFTGTDAPYVPTKKDLVKKALALINLKAGQNFYELGSGDGRVVIAAAQMGATAYGVEQSWLRIWYSRWQARQKHLANCHFLHGNIFSREYYPADVVYIYMLPRAVDRLEKKLQKELKPGATVITQTYHFTNWQSFKTEGNFQYYKV